MIRTEVTRGVQLVARFREKVVTQAPFREREMSLNGITCYALATIIISLVQRCGRQTSRAKRQPAFVRRRGRRHTNQRLGKFFPRARRRLATRERPTDHRRRSMALRRNCPSPAARHRARQRRSPEERNSIGKSGGGASRRRLGEPRVMVKAGSASMGSIYFRGAAFWNLGNFGEFDGREQIPTRNGSLLWPRPRRWLSLHDEFNRPGPRCDRLRTEPARRSRGAGGRGRPASDRRLPQRSERAARRPHSR